jgi:flagellar protein FliS
MTNTYSENYLKNQIESASKEQLLIMFYEGAIRFISRAEIALRNNNFEQKNYCINKASAIIAELSATLDHEIGGQIASDLEALYDFMNRELIKANIENSLDSLKTVKTLLTDLSETWKQAIQINKKATSSSFVQNDNYKPLSIAL